MYYSILNSILWRILLNFERTFKSFVSKLHTALFDFINEKNATQISWILLEVVQIN